MSTREVTFAINQRPDSRFYFDGQAPIKGFDTIMAERPKSWTFYVDMVTDVPWDVADLAFSHYLIAKDLGKPLTAIPAFEGPRRRFETKGQPGNVWVVDDYGHHPTEVLIQEEQRYRGFFQRDGFPVSSAIGGDQGYRTRMVSFGNHAHRHSASG